LMESISDDGWATFAGERAKEARRLQSQRGGRRRAIYASIGA